MISGLTVVAVTGFLNAPADADTPGAAKLVLYGPARGPVREAADESAITFSARYGLAPNMRTLSASVSYADLDLTTAADRDLLQERVRLMAHDLCRRLGENGLGPTAAAPSCEELVVNSSREQRRKAITKAMQRRDAPQTAEGTAP